MPRSYRDVQMYENEIMKMRSEGKSLREIGEQLGLTHKQVHNFVTRYNAKQRKLAAGIVVRKKGRPAKNCVVTEEDNVVALRYKLDRKDARIKQLEMENELMRDFLSLTERK